MIITTNHSIKSKKTSKDLMIIQISDLHYTDFTSLKKLDEIIKKISNSAPDYIIFCGDIFYSICKNYDKLIKFFQSLSKIATVYLTYGNHELMAISENSKNISELKHIRGIYTSVLEEIKNIKKIEILENRSIELEELNVKLTGICMDLDHYRYKKEDPDDFVINVNKFFPNIQDESFFNEIICHSPKVILDKEHFNKIFVNQSADLIHSGHMHNGIVPPILDLFLPKNKGIIDPHGNLFPDLTRGKVEIGGTVGIIGGPLTTISEYHKYKAKLINTVLPSRIEKVYVKKM